jgi:hypothetical protein
MKKENKKTSKKACKKLTDKSLQKIKGRGNDDSVYVEGETTLTTYSGLSNR